MNLAHNTKRKCQPCVDASTLSCLSEEEVSASLMVDLSQWKMKKMAKHPPSSSVLTISRIFVAKNFQAAMDYMNNVAKIAEREGHHPDLHLTSYREVEVVLYTHSVGGITKNDLMLALMLDKEITIDYSPKWIRDQQTK